MSNVFMIGGPNGAGKTTASMVLLPKFLDVFEFVNTDEIAHGLNPVKPETAQVSAGRIMIERIKYLTEAKKKFAFETTCAGHYHLETLKACHVAGYRTHMVFYWLPSADMALQRVKYRVQQGGHDIPEATIRRRYTAGLRNLVHYYLPVVDTALILDNSNVPMGDEGRVIAEKMVDGDLQIVDAAIWQQILAITKKEQHND
jgi:predicted ABC-type ATPase